MYIDAEALIGVLEGFNDPSLPVFLYTGPASGHKAYLKLTKDFLEKFSAQDDGENDVAFLEYLTPSKIASLCGASQFTVIRWIQKRILKAHRLPGGHYRVSYEDYHSFLEEQDMHNLLPINRRGQ